MNNISGVRPRVVRKRGDRGWEGSQALLRVQAERERRRKTHRRETVAGDDRSAGELQGRHLHDMQARRGTRSSGEAILCPRIQAGWHPKFICKFPVPNCLLPGF